MEFAEPIKDLYFSLVIDSFSLEISYVFRVSDNGRQFTAVELQVLLEVTNIIKPRDTHLSMVRLKIL